MRRADDTVQQLERIRGRIQKLAQAPQRLRDLEAELMQLRADSAEVTGDLEVRTMEWLRERQDAETKLQAYRSRARELKAKIEALEVVGAGAPCPTCGRSLQDHFGSVMGDLADEWDKLVQDGRWWRRRREQLELKPPALQELESRSLRLHAEIEALAERVEHGRSALRELEDLRDHAATLERTQAMDAGTDTLEP
ncbi:MAG: hypothetical protein KC645_18295 [Gemmatimonadetes bacterium]|nr:hypothetical protein [Gemmatimonadota bacterium]